MQWKYYEPYELAPVMKNTTHIVSFFHLNISSLYFHKEELTTLISEHNFWHLAWAFDIIGKSECWLELNNAPLNSAQIPGYNFEFIPT